MDYSQLYLTVVGGENLLRWASWTSVEVLLDTTIVSSPLPYHRHHRLHFRRPVVVHCGDAMCHVVDCGDDCGDVCWFFSCCCLWWRNGGKDVNRSPGTTVHLLQGEVAMCGWWWILPTAILQSATIKNNTMNQSNRKIENGNEDWLTGWGWGVGGAVG